MWRLKISQVLLSGAVLPSKSLSRETLLPPPLHRQLYERRPADCMRMMYWGQKASSPAVLAVMISIACIVVLGRRALTEGQRVNTPRCTRCSLPTPPCTRVKRQTEHLTGPLLSLFVCLCLCVCSNDLTGAFDALVECQNRYSQMPRIHDIIVGLVEKGDTELLQKGCTHTHSH